jgi:protein disulfide-isomerase-like protein
MLIIIGCGHCKKLAPIYKKLADSFKDNTNVVIAQIDCDRHAAIATKHNVDAFPTIKLFGKNNKAIDYNGSNNLKGLLGFVKKHCPKELIDINSKNYGTDPAMDKHVRDFFTNPKYNERVYEQAGERARSTKDL